MVEQDKVLIVEDDNNFFKLISIHLSLAQIPFIRADNKETALSLIKEQQYAVILLDANLTSNNGEDGKEIGQEIRESTLNKDAHVINISADDGITNPYATEAVTKTKIVESLPTFVDKVRTARNRILAIRGSV